MQNTLKTFIVSLLEDAEASETIQFECQAEDEAHAHEQALNAYPQAKIVSTRHLDVLIGQWPQVGDKVWWTDPDEDLSTGLYTVRQIHSESGTVESFDTILLLAHEGSLAEVFAHELSRPPSLQRLADDVRNSESDEGCQGGFTVVHRAKLLTLLEEINSSDMFKKAEALQSTRNALSQAMQHVQDVQRRRDEAIQFMRELLDSTETLLGISEQYGPRTLADLMYLHSAIVSGGYIDFLPGESAVLELVQQLPSAACWVQFIKTEDVPSQDVAGGDHTV